MASYEYNGNTYFYAIGRGWVDGVSNPVKPEVASALSNLYPEKDVIAKEKAERSKRAVPKKNVRKPGRPFGLSRNSQVSGPRWHKKAIDRSYDQKYDLKPDQKRALAALETGKNVFLTGEAGTGKSFVLKEFMRRNRSKNIIVCAFTGIAAINVGGSTIHRVFKAPLGIIKPGEYNSDPPELIVKADIIVIDEISMCRIDLFEYVIRTIRAAENKRQYFENQEAMENGRIPRVLEPKQIIVVGDFYQLAPVIGQKNETAFYTFWNRDTICDGFAFASPLWYELGFKNVVLKEIVRQSGDTEYIQNLNKVRVGDASGISWFNEHISLIPLQDAIYLCGTNAEADSINEQRSIALPGEAKIYRARSSGTVGDGDKMTSDELALKVGMQVMTLINETNRQYQNGSIGKIVALGDDHVDVKFDNGRVASVVYYDWEINGFEVQGEKIEKVVLGNFKQLPLKIAYAITIHKSQGQTYSRVNISPKCFAPGQLYVALSRAESSKGMSFGHIIELRSLRTNFHVKRFYDELIEDEDTYELREIEGPERKQFEPKVDAPELPRDDNADADDETRHPIFEKVMNMSDEEADSCYMYRAIRDNLSAYAPWSEKEDDQLLRELAQKMKIREISQIHQRTGGAIRSRIKKLKGE